MNPSRDLLQKIRDLEQLLVDELHAAENKLQYRLRKGKVIFEKQIQHKHRQLAKSLFQYVRDSAPLSWLTAPIIYSLLFPAVLLDLFVTIYQSTCFPAYGIPKVRRQDYIILDRHKLVYLNLIERLNCVYCGYFNGLLAYVREIAARTEQYWCPIRHARMPKGVHSRYHLFFDYGDAEEFRNRYEVLRREYEDLPRP